MRWRPWTWWGWRSTERVAFAQRHTAPGLRFVRGSVVLGVGKARLIRAMNVMRQYRVSAVDGALAQWRASCPTTACCSRVPAAKGFAPARLRPYLPRGLTAASFLRAWQRAFEAARAQPSSPERLFEASVERLGDAVRSGDAPGTVEVPGLGREGTVPGSI